jgi:hypothetical protein
MPALRALTALIVASLACGLPGVPNSSSGASAPTPGGTAADAGTQPETTPTIPVEPPPPSGLIDSLRAGVDAGRWTYEEGLVQSLKLFIGETNMTDVYPEPPASMEGFGLVREAQRYLRLGTDAAVKTEIERLLDIIAPPPERLLEYASPAPTGSSGSPGLAAPAKAAEDCEKLYADGFPPGSGIKCLLLKEGGISGQTVRVFWPMIAITTDYADAAYNGVLTAWQKYAQLTPPAGISVLKGVDVVFSLLNAQEGPSILAMVPSTSTDQRCLIAVYLPAIAENEQAKGSPDDYGHFLQTIAHEMFHCYQVWNFPEQADDTWSVQDWWGEGTATYFSNVVWPEVNGEWEWLPAFAYHSADTSVVNMSYDNFAFFQFLGDSIGDDGVLKLIASMPFGGDEQGQASALAAFPNIQQLFHDFGRAYMDGTIVDSSGQPLPTAPPYFAPGHKIDVTTAQIRTLDVQPFVLGRYAFRFAQGRQWLVSQQLTGSAEGYLSARTDMAIGAWGDFPEKVLAGCAPVIYYVVLTNASAQGAFATEVTITPDKELGCDQCLVGTWDLNIDSFTEYVESPFAKTPGLYQFDSAGGLWRYHFRADGTMTGEFDFFYNYELNQENAPFGNDITVNGAMTIKGTGDGTYQSDGVSNLTFGLVKDAVTIAQDLYMNGQKMAEGPLDQGGLGGSTGAAAVYSCDDEAGELLINYAPSTDLPPILFNRVSKTP